MLGPNTRHLTPNTEHLSYWTRGTPRVAKSSPVGRPGLEWPVDVFCETNIPVNWCWSAPISHMLAKPMIFDCFAAL